MNQKQLRRATIRTLRAGIIRKHPPGERRDHLLARLEVIVEQSRLIEPSKLEPSMMPCEEA